MTQAQWQKVIKPLLHIIYRVYDELLDFQGKSADQKTSAFLLIGDCS